MLMRKYDPNTDVSASLLRTQLGMSAQRNALFDLMSESGVNLDKPLELKPKNNSAFQSTYFLYQDGSQRRWKGKNVYFSILDATEILQQTQGIMNNAQVSKVLSIQSSINMALGADWPNIAVCQIVALGNLFPLTTSAASQARNALFHPNSGPGVAIGQGHMLEIISRTIYALTKLPVAVRSTPEEAFKTLLHIIDTNQ